MEKNRYEVAEFPRPVTRCDAEVTLALSGLDVDAPYIRVWGKHYRRVHRVARTYGSLAGPVTVERTLSCIESRAVAKVQRSTQ